MTRRLLFLLLGTGALICAAQSDLPTQVDRPTRELPSDQPWNTRAFQAEEAPAPKVDSKKIINDSNSFLKEREPEMNSEEYALYQKVVTILNSNAEFAIKLLEGMMTDKEAPSPAFEFMLGNAYYTAGQNENAEVRYRSAVSRFPTFLRAWNNLGVLYYTMGRYGDAVACLSKSVTLGDHDATTLGLLAYSLEKTGDTVSAEMDYMQALGSEPKNANWKEGLVRLYINGKQYDRAEPLVRTLVREIPTEKRYWLMYAHVLLSQQRRMKAIAILEMAARAKVSGAEELSLLGDLYAEQNLIPEAAAVYEQLLASQPQLGERKLMQYAQVLIAAEKYTQAEEVLKSFSVNLTPAGQVTLLQTKADLRVAQKRWPEAREELNKLLAVAPLNGRALLSLGRTYATEEDYPRATFAFEAAIKIPATAYRASLELADIELKSRHYRKGAEYLEKALNLERTDEVADLLARVRTLTANEN